MLSFWISSATLHIVLGKNSQISRETVPLSHLSLIKVSLYVREDYYTRTASDNDDSFSGYDLRANESITQEGLGEYSASLFSRKAVEVTEYQIRVPEYRYNRNNRVLYTTVHNEVIRVPL